MPRFEVILNRTIYWIEEVNAPDEEVAVALVEKSAPDPHEWDYGDLLEPETKLVSHD